jgi:HD-GYP domain-containing protein (c-di-GMP phosphodiesterase class II)
MTSSKRGDYRRILIVDDDGDRRWRWCEILSQPSGPVAGNEIDHAGQDPANSDTARVAAPCYRIEWSTDSAAAMQRVATAAKGRDWYELAIIGFPDSSPSEDLAALRKLWGVDPRLQTILCVPDSPNTLDEFTRSLGLRERLLILGEPIRDAEMRQAVFTMTEKWRMAHQLGLSREQHAEHIRDAARLVEIIHGCERELASSRDDLQVQSARLSAQLKARVDEILGTRDVMVFALERLAESRDAETGEHLERLRAYSQILAEDLAVTGPYTSQITGTFLRDFALSTPLHDIGKVGIPDSVLRKPGRLDLDEFDVMKQHTIIGAEALLAAARQSVYGEFLLMAADIARSHHEWFDGTGYPDGLAGLDIPLPARIVAVADVFDAMTSRRVYKDEQAANEAREAIIQGSGGHFDPHVVNAFERRYKDFLAVKDENFSFRMLEKYFGDVEAISAG